MADHHDDVRFERTDVTIGPVVSFLAVLGVSLGLIMGVLWLAQDFLMESEHKPATHPLAATGPQLLPPEPQIEGLGLDKATHSVTNSDLATSARSQRIAQEKILAEGWTDAAGRKHPPIDEAIKQLVAKLAKEKP